MMPEVTARRRRTIALLIAVPVVLAAAAWVLTYTSLFAARTIHVDGNHVLSDRYVRSVARISTSTNVAHLDEAGVIGRLEADPWVASASVRTDLPHTLIVAIDERRPLGLILGLGERSVLASDGASLPVAGVTLGNLPIVRAALGAPTQEQRAAAARVLSALDPVVFDRVHQVVVGGNGSLTLELSSGAVVDLGSAGAEHDKAAALRAVLRWAATHNVDVTSIDVSSPAAPSIKLSDGSTTGI
jgi:cell division protein FtsQ